MGILAKYNMAFDIPEEFKDAKVLKIQEMVGNHYILDGFQMYDSKADKNAENPRGVSLFFLDAGQQKFRCSTHAGAIIETCENIMKSGDDIKGTPFTIITKKTKNGNTVYLFD